ncbi:MAG: SdrD B-like domain-containing protein [Candidatus Thermoplasmatota archaeon]|nr:SdrD B-like domain-containing protein [Candidatus Thermoplasmatota archaeon]
MEPPYGLGIQKTTQFTPEVRGVLNDYFEASMADKIEDVYFNTEKYIDEVLSNPARFGPRDGEVTQLTPQNVRYTMMKTLILENIEYHAELVGFYRDIRQATGHDIGYLAVDSRLFPFSAQNTGIFYAPAILSDHRVSDDATGRIPIDFYEIIIVTDMGEFKITDDIPPDAVVEDYKIEYKDMFYNSMLYRTYVGYSGKDLGGQGGIPVVNMQGYDIMPAWNMKNFRIVYRTTFWNPESDADLTSRTWQAVSYEQAMYYSEQEIGTVLDPAYGVFYGVTMIQYYDGAFVNGTVETESGLPAPNILVTVHDEYGIPHDSTYTDENGRYSVLGPFGNLSIIISTGGSLNPMTMTEQTKVETIPLNLTYEQAMRKKDYEIEIPTIFVSSGSVSGRVFLDVDGDSIFASGKDEPFAGAEVTITNQTYNITETQTAAAGGAYSFDNLIPGTYNISAVYKGERVQDSEVVIGITSATKDLFQISGEIKGAVRYPGGGIAEGVRVTINSQLLDTPINVYTDNGGLFEVGGLRPGEYSFSAAADQYFYPEQEVMIGQNATIQKNFELSRGFSISGTVTRDGVAVPNANIRFLDRASGKSWTATSVSNGTFQTNLPYAEYEASCRYVVSNQAYLDIKYASPLSNPGVLNMELQPAVRISGRTRVQNENNTPIPAAITLTKGEITITTTSNGTGHYVVELLPGQWSLHAQSRDGGQAIAALQNMQFFNTRSQDIIMSNASQYNVLVSSSGRDGIQGDEVHGAKMTVTGGGFTSVARADISGSFTFFLPDSFEYVISANAYGYTEANTNLRTDGNVTEISIGYTNITLSGQLDTLAHPADQGSLIFTGSGGHTIEVAPNATGYYSASLWPDQYTISLEYNVSPDTQLMLSERVLLGPGYPPVIQDLFASVAYEFTGFFENYQDSDGQMRLHVYDEQGERMQPEQAIGEDSQFSFYLPTGDVFVRIFNEEGTRGATAKLSVAAPFEQNITLQETAWFVGNLTKGAQDKYTIPIPVLFKDETNQGLVKVTSDPSGMFRLLAISDQRYTVTVNFTPEVPIDGVYKNLAYNMALQRPQSKDIILTATPLTANVVGQVTADGVSHPATLDFISQGGTAVTNRGIVANATGHYNVALTPGSYLLHATSPTHSSFMGVEIPSSSVKQDEYSLPVSVSPGFEIRGLTAYTNLSQVTKSPASEDLVITREGFTLKLETDIDGRYSVFLPPGPYSLTIDVTESEFGITNTYRVTESTVITDADSVVDLAMVRQPKYASTSTYLGGDITLNPGQSTTINVVIKNDGNMDDRIKMSGTPSDWVFSFTPSEFNLPFRSNRTVQVTITAPENARSDHEAVRITATSNHSAASTSSATIPIIVPQTFSFSSATVPDVKMWDGTLYRRDFTINNTGNGPETYTIRVLNSNEVSSAGWKVEIVGAGVTSNETSGEFFVTVTKGLVTLTARAESTAETPSPVDMVLTIISDQSSQQQITLSLDGPVLGIGDIDAEGAAITEVTGGPSALVVFVIVLGALLAIMLLFGRQKKGRKRRR